MSLRTFHPAVSNWFARAFPAPTPAQLRAWPAIRSGSHALVAAPTGSGKTLAAFLCALDDLVKRGVQMPLSLIILGVFGGFVAFGFLGLFIGPTMLAVGLVMLRAWQAKVA